MNNQNDIFNEIITEILKELYKTFGNPDMSTSLDVTLHFDDQQRIANITNLMIDNNPKVPPFDLIEKLNTISQKLLELQEKYRLEECTFKVASGGKMDITPVYKLK